MREKCSIRRMKDSSKESRKSSDLADSRTGLRQIYRNIGRKLLRDLRRKGKAVAAAILARSVSIYCFGRRKLEKNESKMIKDNFKMTWRFIMKKSLEKWRD